MSINMTGTSFGMLTVLRRCGSDAFQQAMWLCQCSCGNTKQIRGRDIRTGTTKSCGCLRAALMKSKKTTHDSSNTRLYAIWSGMKSRCSNPNNPLYGGAGISVCDEWVDNFSTFREWSMNNGYSDDRSIDRKNGSLGYSPGNCRWATRSQQNRNTANRSKKHSKYRGVSRMRNRWVAYIGVNNKTKVLGYFSTEIEAALAYDDAARGLGEECVILNCP